MTIQPLTKSQGIVLLAALLIGCSWPISPALGDDAQCDLARKIATTATEKFAKDKKEGLRLFLKALEYCPDDGAMNYNAGLACYQYGNLGEAEKYLRNAVEKNGNEGDWLNLLAWVLLESGADRAYALKCAKEAAHQNNESAAFSDTLIRAHLENGELTNALALAGKSREKWPKDSRIKEREEKALEAYRAYYLAKAKEGKTDETLAALRKMETYPAIKNDLCWVLFRSGNINGALEEANQGLNTFRGDQALQNTFDQIADSYIRDRYQEFKGGKRADAVRALEGMKNKYPTHKPFAEAHDKLFEAILAEADTVAIPEPVRIASTGKAGGQADKILGELQGAGASPGGAVDIVVDVDKDIPKGRMKRKDGIAVIIGNGHYIRYGNGIPDVAYAARDASYMKRYVVETLGFDEKNVIYEQDVTQGSLATIFGTENNYRGKLYNYVKAGKSDVFVYYTGHGAPDPAGKGAFIVPVDANVDYIASNGYPLDTFYKNLGKVREKIGSGKMTVILDACFSGDSGGGFLFQNISPAMIKTASPVGNLEEAVIFTSAGESEVSQWYPDKRHSLFTYFFMKGLQGDADRNKNRTITVGEMRDYLKDNVPYLARRLGGREQNPIIVGDDSLELVSFR